jgi:flagellar hook-length control protein FliK
MGLSLDLAFPGERLSSISKCSLTQSGEDQSDTPFVLHDHSDESETPVRSTTTEPSSGPSTETMDQNCNEDAHAIESETSSFEAAETAVTDEVIAKGDEAPASTLSALPDSMIWMQPQDFLALLKADLNQLTTESASDVTTALAPVLAETTSSVSEDALSADVPDRHTLSASTTTTAVDPAVTVLSASLITSPLGVWLTTPLAAQVDTSAEASSGGTMVDTLWALRSPTDGFDAVEPESLDANSIKLAVPIISASNAARESGFTTAGSGALSGSTTFSAMTPTPGEEATAPLTPGPAIGAMLSVGVDGEALRQSPHGTRMAASSAVAGATTAPLTSSGLLAPSFLSPPASSPLVVDTSRSAWSQQLVDSLGERVHLQASQQLKQATIRLDPPELGRLEVTVRQEHDRLSVQISTSNSSLRDALQESREQLRQILIPEYGAGVEVEINYSGDGRQQAQAQALLDEAVMSNGLLPSGGGEASDSIATVVNTGLLDTLV